MIVDGKVADLKTQVYPGSEVQTGEDSEVIFVVASDAFILRSNSNVQLGEKGLLVQGNSCNNRRYSWRVFGKRDASHQVVTSTATIGIRGTGIYVESCSR